ncbi:MobV family relaxase [Halomonas halocynthiae]|uniref:MobV family relaxase n=1 Tax=Halomonas halocynthiae TaxID=176290 RepID=UPI0003FA936A|nr:MobV family relaxase [Halomonas halocynthiae]
MAVYAILRTKKLKTVQDVAGSGSHVFRLRETPNADSKRKKENKILVSIESNLLHQLVNSRIEQGLNEKAKVRKDSVRAIEFILTASPEWFEKATKEQFEEWQEANIDWLKLKYGEDNLVSAVLHLDEQTPHIHAHVVPVTADGRLSAKDLIGGTRARHRQLQSDYAKAMEDLGLERGSEKSIAKHQDIKAYYNSVNKAKNEKIKMPKIEEPPRFVGRERYTKKLRKRIKSILIQARYWKHEYLRLEGNSNSKAVEQAEKKRRNTEVKVRKLSEMYNNLLDKNQKITTEYYEYREKKKKEMSEINNANERLKEKNRLLNKKTRRRQDKSLSI